MENKIVEAINKIKEIKEEFKITLEEKRNQYENMTESDQFSETGEKVASEIQNLDIAVDGLEEAIFYIEKMK